MSKPNPKGWALVTGASSGIGEALSVALAQKGFHLLLVARSQDRLEALAAQLSRAHGIETRVLGLDLTQAEAPAQVASQCEDLPLTVVVNNAGFSVFGPFTETPYARYQQMMLLNIGALAELTHLLLPRLRHASPQGYLLNVGSIAGEQGVPFMGFYAATKAFVNVFTQSLAWEEPRPGVHICCLMPGKTETEFFRNAQVGQGHERFVKQGTMTAAEVATEGLNALFQGRERCITGWTNQLSVAASRHLPDWLVRPTMKHLFGEFKDPS
jgi:hypothetical protein